MGFWSACVCTRLPPLTSACLFASLAFSSRARVVAPVLTAMLGRSFDEMDAADESYTPLMFVAALRSAFAQFNEVDARSGVHKQQDADELYNSVLGTLARDLTKPAAGVDLAGTGNMVDALFQIEFETKYVVLGMQRHVADHPCLTVPFPHVRRLKCNESDAEPEVVQRERTRKLRCNIDGGAGAAHQINHLSEGIKLVRYAAAPGAACTLRSCPSHPAVPPIAGLGWRAGEAVGGAGSQRHVEQAAAHQPPAQVPVRAVHAVLLEADAQQPRRRRRELQDDAGAALLLAACVNVSSPDARHRVLFAPPLCGHVHSPWRSQSTTWMCTSRIASVRGRPAHTGPYSACLPGVTAAATTSAPRSSRRS